MENEAKIETKTESKQLGKHLCNIIVKTILTIISVALVGFSIFNIYALINFYDCAPDWRNDHLALTSYRITANHYDNQKQLVINAYNKQIDKIEKQGLKTRNNFDGIKFRDNVFRNDMHNDRDGSVWDLVSHSDFMPAGNKVFDNADRKINTLRKYYDEEINNIYSKLQNNQKVDFESLKEYSDGPKFAQFTYDDFDAAGKKYSEYSNYGGQLFKTFILIVVTVICVGITIVIRF